MSAVCMLAAAAAAFAAAITDGLDPDLLLDFLLKEIFLFIHIHIVSQFHSFIIFLN
jgi:hypothetical protein